MSSSRTFARPPPEVDIAKLSFPAPRVLLVTISRPKALNAIAVSGSWELASLFEWFDEEPSLWVSIVTGEGRTFSAGADLKAWNDEIGSGSFGEMPASGFAGLSRRNGKKPVIAAVNGIAYGGGFEAVVNCDLVIACATAKFCFPEVKRGVAPFAGAMPRLVRSIGKQRAMELMLTGRVLPAQEAKEWGLVNVVCPEGQDVVDEALKWAKVIAENSPDSVIVTKQGINWGWEGVGADEGTRISNNLWHHKLLAGDNIKEGLKAFIEKRSPRWADSKL
ncbi:Enoyl-CoA hydratase [Trichoderma ghanense]|uniref:Enoyl-CoA hydratase n=1 Tax=Trichoderma ghanense TaxID=65468 RepID=A0ABY2GV20_9HYPO